MAKTKQLNNKESKEIIAVFKEFDIDIGNYSKFEIVNTDKNQIIRADKEIIGFYFNNKIYPSLKLNLDKSNIKNIYLDLGAIPFITKGADLMAPGIKDLEQFNKDSLVVLRDAVHKKALALGIAEFSSEDIKTMEKGKAIKTIHYIGDKIWNYK